MNMLNKIIAALLFGLSSTQALAITDNQVFAYAEANYASLFAGTASSGQYQQYNYRYYPATGNYLAVDSAGVIYILGPVSGGRITSVGPVSAFEGAVTAWEATQASTGYSAASGTPLSTRLLGTWKLVTIASSANTAAKDVSAWGITIRIDASTYTFALPAAITDAGGTYAACTETDSWTLNGNTLTTTVTASPVSSSICNPVGGIKRGDVALNGNTLTVTNSSTGAVSTYSLQSSAPITPLSTRLLGTWKLATSASSGSSTATDVSGWGMTTRIDASTHTFTFPGGASNAGANYAACTETSSWKLNGNTLTTTVTASPVSGSFCDPVGTVTTGTVAVNGNTLTLSYSSGVVNTFTLQSTANSTTPAANTTTTGTTTPSTGTGSAGISWKLTNIPGFSIPNLSVVRYLNKQWVAAGFGAGGGGSLITLNGNLVVNDKITIPTNYTWINSAAYGKGLYVAGGSSNTIITSPDTINWTARVSAFPNSYSSLRDINIAFGNGKFVAVSGFTASDALPPFTENVQTSTDGITWTAVDMTAHKVTEGSQTYPAVINRVTFGNGQFIALGRESYSYYAKAATYTSIDGVTWVKNTGIGSFATSGNNIKFAGGQYIVVGESGLVLTSPDGITWKKRTAVTPNRLNDVAYGNGKYVAVGDTGTMIESNDGGVTWTALSALTTYHLRSIDFANNQFIAVGEYVLITSQ